MKKTIRKLIVLAAAVLTACVCIFPAAAETPDLPAFRWKDYECRFAFYATDLAPFGLEETAGLFPDSAGNILAVLSGICYAGVFMMNTGKNADAVSSCFIGQLAAGLLFTPLCFQENDFSAPVLSAVLALGIVQVGGAYVLFSIGIRHVPPVAASLITGMEPILNPLLVAVFYGEAVSALSLVGSVIVVCSILAYNLILARKQTGRTAESA